MALVDGSTGRHVHALCQEGALRVRRVPQKRHTTVRIWRQASQLLGFLHRK